MTLRRACLMLLSLGLLAGLAPAQDDSASDLSAWIDDLGSPAIDVRQEAVDQLRAAGPAALAAVREASETHDDPEVRWNAAWLARELATGQAPAGRFRARDRFSGLQAELDRMFQELEEMQERLRLGDDPFGARTLPVPAPLPGERIRRFRMMPGGQIQEQHNSMSFMQNEDGSVRVEIIERTDDGEVETKVYEAPSIEELHKQNPELAERYGLDSQQGGFRIEMHGKPLEDGELPSPGKLQPVMPQAGDQERLGVIIEPTSTEEAEAHGLEPGHGLKVREVIEGSLAESLGVEAGDFLLHINGAHVTDTDSVRQALAATPAGDTIDLEVLRAGERLHLAGTKPAPTKRMRWF